MRHCQTYVGWRQWLVITGVFVDRGSRTVAYGVADYNRETVQTGGCGYINLHLLAGFSLSCGFAFAVDAYIIR